MKPLRRLRCGRSSSWSRICARVSMLRMARLPARWRRSRTIFRPCRAGGERHRRLYRGADGKPARARARPPPAMLPAGRARPMQAHPRAARTRPPMPVTPTMATRFYRTACADCHDGGRRGIALAYSTSVTDTTPANLIRVTLDGIHPREGETGEVMPALSRRPRRRAARVAGRVPAHTLRPRAAVARCRRRGHQSQARAGRRRPEAIMITLNVNGRAHEVDADPATPLALRVAQRAQAQRRQIRLRARAMRCLHGHGRRRSGLFVPHADPLVLQATRDQDPGRTRHRRRSRSRCSRHSSTSRPRSAATALPA